MIRGRRTFVVGLVTATGLCQSVRANYVLTMGPVLAPAGPAPFPWTLAHPANTLTVTPLGARVGTPAAFTQVGVSFNPLPFPRPFFALTTVFNTPAIAATILAKDSNPSTPELELTGFQPDELVGLTDLDWVQSGQTFDASALGVVDAANLASIPELADMQAFLVPDASGQVPYATFTIPEPGTLVLLTAGAILILRRGRPRRRSAD